MTQLFLAIATSILCTQAPAAQEPKSDITDKEAVEFARKIELDQAEGRETAFDDLFDREGLIEGAAAGLDLTPKEKADFLEGFKQASFGKAIGAAQGVSYDFLRARRVEGRHVLTFRVWGQSLNYHELQIKKTPAGLRIADMFVYMGGEWTGASARRLLMGVAASDPVRRKKLPAGAVAWADHMSSLREYASEAQSDEAHKALARFKGYPEAIRKDRMIQTLRILAAARVGDDELTRAADEYTRLFPGDACRDIVCLDSLIVRKEFGKSLESLDRIDKAVGGDPLLDVIRGRLHLMQGKTAPAREWALRAVKNLPKLADPHWILVEITLKEKKYAETVERLDALEKALGAKVRAASLESDPEYADFLKSPEGRDWMKSSAPK